MYIIAATLFVVLFTGTGISIILLVNAWPEVKQIWKDVKDE